MKPPPFGYVAPRSLEEALEALAQAGEDAKVIAGGQSLVPLLSLRMARPTVLVDLNRVPGLDRIDAGSDGLTIGAMTRHRAVERSTEVGGSVPLLAEAMPLIGHAAIRSRGTMGGSIAHADPAAELPAVAAALGATITLSSAARGSRTVPAEEFFQGYFTTAADPDEILTAITFPMSTPGTGHRFVEVARRHGDFAMVGAGVSVTVEDGTIRDARIAVLNVSDVPVRARAAEAMLVGAPPSDEAFADAATAATADLEPNGDLHASPAYRRHVGAVCIRRALRDAADRALENR